MFGDKLLELCLALGQRQLSQVVAVETEQNRRDERGLQFVLQDGKVGRAVRSRDNGLTILTIDDRRSALTSKASAAIFPKRFVQSLPPASEDCDCAVGDMHLNPVAIELDLMNPARADGTLSTDVASAGSTKPG